MLPIVVFAHLLACASLAAESTTGRINDPAGAAPPVAYDAVAPKGPGPFALIVALHGINGNEHQLVGQLSADLQELGLADRCVVLGLKSQGAGWEDIDHAPIRVAVAWASATWPIDRRRVFAWGYSHGAFRLGVFGHQAQQLFAGVVLLSGGVSGSNQPDAPTPTLPWYIIHGDADAVVNVDNSRKGATALRSLGYPVVYREIPGEGHATAGSAAAKPFRVDALAWTDHQRNALVPLPANCQALFDAAAAQTAAGKKPNLTKLLPAAVLAGGPQG
ncbi:MAG: hypothetical protein H0W72_14985, partial [Planctomycetes bacterium]|nr:hypothetical protein [Planctomycetota bacterium]